MNLFKSSYLVLFAFVCGSLFFTSCQKDAIDDLATTDPSAELNIADLDGDDLADSDDTYNAYLKSSASNGVNDTIDLELCDCFSVFDGVDFDQDRSAVKEAVEAVLAGLTDADKEALFTPVCTEEEWYPNACVADCNGITAYEECERKGHGGGKDGKGHGGGKDGKGHGGDRGDHGGEKGDCDDFLDDITYPYELTLPDCSVVTVNNEDELFDAVDTYYEAIDPMVNYPVTIQFVDGTTVDVNSDDELDETFEAWFDTFFEGIDEENTSRDEIHDLLDENEPTIVYPVSFTMADGSTVTVNNDDEADDLYDSIEEGDCGDDFGLGKVAGVDEFGPKKQKAALKVIWKKRK